MELPEATSHSFVVKIWLEKAADEAGGAKWRGHITHVLDGKRHYVESLHEITSFIELYLQAMGQVACYRSQSMVKSAAA